MGRLVFVGLGLGSRGLSLEGLEALRSAGLAYVEYYTSPHEPELLAVLEKAASRSFVVVDRGFVEDGSAILAEAKKSSVALAVAGDPMIATTHSDLRTRAIREGIETRVIHGATIGTAAASASGLHFYKFGRTVTITLDAVDRLTQAYHIVHDNLRLGAHTLLLLEHDVDRDAGVAPGKAAEGLLAAEANFKRGVLGDATFVLVLSRVGRADQGLWAGSLSEAREVEFGNPPHCMVVPGSIHFTEAEAVESVFGVPKGRVIGNSDSQRTTAQALVPRYVEKTRRALDSVRGRLGPEYAAVLENVELYMKDSQNFLADGEDEMAMLSIGYAEGLLDSLSFAGVAKIDW